jgi:hypothetical protein
VGRSNYIGSFPAVQPITKDYTFYLWLVPEYEGLSWPIEDKRKRVFLPIAQPENLRSYPTMATEAEQKWDGTASTRKRRRTNDHDHEQLKILRLDLHTIMAQIKILEHEMEVDPCLSTHGIATVLSLVDALKQDLEGTRLRIRKLKAQRMSGESRFLPVSQLFR